jgi:hypothetical protein
MSAKFDQIIYNTAVKNGFTPLSARFVVAQARLESADYTSNVFKNNLNTSGMKFINQPLAKKGTIVPYNERSESCKTQNICKSTDYYAKFDSVDDSAKDKIERLYSLTRNGVTPEQLKNAKTPEEFAKLLKIRGYYGFGSWNTPAGQKEINQYADFISSKLRRITVVEMYDGNKGKIWTFIGLILVGAAVYFYLYPNKQKGIKDIFKTS